MDWVIVQVVIGLSFLFFLLSVISSAVQEAVAGIFKLRARLLEKGVLNLVSGSTSRRDGGGLEVVRALYSSSLISSYGKDTSKPSYLSSRSFRNALFEVTDLLDATGDPSTDPLKVDEIRARVESQIDAIPLEHLRDSLLTIWRGVDRDATEFRAGVERWFDRGMDRVSGWYKRRTQLILFFIGLVLALAMNASAITAADRLWKDDGTRRALVAQAESQQGDTGGTAALERLEQLRFPIGWEEPNRPGGVDGWALAILGWVVSGFAVTFGAPFWFDMLGKVSNLRSTGRKPDSSLVPAPTKSEISTVRLSLVAESPGSSGPGGPPS